MAAQPVIMWLQWSDGRVALVSDGKIQVKVLVRSSQCDYQNHNPVFY